MKKSVIPFALTLAVFAAGATAADDIYRSIMPDGSIRYGESPAPGAKSSRRIPPPPATTGTITVTPEEKGRDFSVQPAPAVVLTPPQRSATTPHEQGKLQSPQGLPQRSY